ncbi:RNA polymerase sigma factor [Microbispora hainanensis]|nr:sigma factor [Microbispora hainanensis]
MSPSSGDHELMAAVAAVAAARVEALRLLHDRHAPWLRARLLRRCADPDLVDDAIQDTFVAVWRGARRYAPQGDDAAAWIWTIAVRRLASALRRPGGRWIAAAAPGAVRRCPPTPRGWPCRGSGSRRRSPPPRRR